MDITNNRILVLGGSGLVGSATCHYILSHFRPSALILAGRSESKIRDVVADLSSFADEGVLSWRTGDIFSRDAFKHLSRKQIFSDHAKRDRFVKDIIDPLNDDIYRSSFLQQIIHEEYQDIIIDCVNSSTALAYQDVFEESRKLFSDTHSPLKDLAREELLQEVEILLGTQYTPQLIRHIQVLWRCLCEHKVKMYVKVGTTGTGGLGLNIPFTHSEDQPSRVLLAKSAMAGAHSMLLFLLGRSALQGQADARWRYDRNLKPLPPIIKEVKPAAVITWKSIDFGEIKHRGQGIRLVDHKPDDALDFSDALNPQNHPGRKRVKS